MNKNYYFKERMPLSPYRLLNNFLGSDHMLNFLFHPAIQRHVDRYLTSHIVASMSHLEFTIAYMLIVAAHIVALTLHVVALVASTCATTVYTTSETENIATIIAHTGPH